MWIRSQDKKMLGNYQSFWIEGNSIYAETTNPKYRDCLGTYESKERAIEVLDEIQMQIQSCTETTIADIKRLPVFEMPKE